MLQWIDKVLAPHLQEKAAGAPACILLDRFSAHWTNGIKTKIESLGLTPYKIPAGCTGLTQPINVGVGKPFKDHARQKWWDWLLTQDATDAAYKLATREQGTEWVLETWNTLITDTIVKNAWRKSGFSYFVED